MSNLIGVGPYTPTEASRLLHVPAAKISRSLWRNTVTDEFVGNPHLHEVAKP
jgi:hypothetical protein